MYNCMYVIICAYVCVCISLSLYTYIYIYIHAYIHTHRSSTVERDLPETLWLVQDLAGSILCMTVYSMYKSILYINCMYNHIRCII